MCVLSLLLCTCVLVAPAASVPPRAGPPPNAAGRPPMQGSAFRPQAVPMLRQPPGPASGPRPTTITIINPPGAAQSRVAHPGPYQGPPSRPPFVSNHQFGNGVSPYNQIPSGALPHKLNPSTQNLQNFPPFFSSQLQRYTPSQIVSPLNTLPSTHKHYSPSYHRPSSYQSYAPHSHYHEPVHHYLSHYGHRGSHHHGHHHHPRPPPDELLDLMSPLKKEDAMFPPSSNHPGSLYGMMVPLMLLGISIPAIGFVYTYFSKRSLDSGGVVSISMPSQEDIDYYLNILQRGIACFQDPKDCSM